MLISRVFFRFDEALSFEIFQLLIISIASLLTFCDVICSKLNVFFYSTTDGQLMNYNRKVVERLT